MHRESPHPAALHNYEMAFIPEGKIRGYALRDPNKRRPFGALGFSEEAGNWERLRDAILEGLPGCPAVFDKRNEWGTFFEVVVPVSGTSGKEAPVRTYWIYRWGEDFPRLATLFIDTEEWARWKR